MAGTIKHSWNGTVLTIESDSGVSSMDLKGDKGDIGVRGPRGLDGIDGLDGSGADVNLEDITPEAIGAAKAEHTHTMPDIEGLESLNSRFNTLEENVLTEADKQSIINETLNALAGADTNNATAAVVENLQRKVKNMAEDIATLQQEVNEYEMLLVENLVKIACRLVQIERTLNIQPPISTEGWDTTTDADSIYDNTDWQ